MKNNEKSFLQHSCLLYMDILGAKNLIEDSIEKQQLIKTLVEQLLAHCRSYQKTTSSFNTNSCGLMLISEPIIPATIERINEFPLHYDAAYLINDNDFYYICKSRKILRRITFDNQMRESLMIKLRTDGLFRNENELKILSDEELNQIELILGPHHVRGVSEIIIEEPEISSFSDHVAMSLPFSEINILYLIQLASWLHHQALSQGLLMRGAITIGDLYHKGNAIMGRALNEAVKIEENISIYPRVIIPHEIIELLPQNMPISLGIDFDGLYYVHYMTDSRYINEETKKAIFENIYQNIKNPKNIRVYAKWQWLAIKFGIAPTLNKDNQTVQLHFN